MWAPRARGRVCAAKPLLVDDLDQRDDLVARDPVGQLRMVAAEMIQREVDELILGLAADDLAALACDLPGHGWVSRRLSGPSLSRMLAQRLERGGARGRHLRAALRALRGRALRPPRRA